MSRVYLCGFSITSTIPGKCVVYVLLDRNQPVARFTNEYKQLFTSKYIAMISRRYHTYEVFYHKNITVIMLKKWKLSPTVMQ